MTVSQAFRTPRLTLVSGVLRAVYPLAPAKAVSLGNATTGDLYIYTNDDLSEYLVLTSGYERMVDLAMRLFHPQEVAFWLKADQSGTVTVTWS